MKPLPSLGRGVPLMGLSKTPKNSKSFVDYRAGCRTSFQNEAGTCEKKWHKTDTGNSLSVLVSPCSMYSSPCKTRHIDQPPPHPIAPLATDWNRTKQKTGFQISKRHLLHVGAS